MPEDPTPNGPPSANPRLTPEQERTAEKPRREGRLATLPQLADAILKAKAKRPIKSGDVPSRACGRKQKGSTSDRDEAADSRPLRMGPTPTSMGGASFTAP